MSTPAPPVIMSTPAPPVMVKPSVWALKLTLEPEAFVKTVSMLVKFQFRDYSMVDKFASVFSHQMELN